MEKIIPELHGDKTAAEYAKVFGLDAGISDASNHVAAILVNGNFKLRSCGMILARVIGWLACQAHEDIEPSAFIKAVADQSLNYYGAFSARVDR